MYNDLGILQDVVSKKSFFKEKYICVNELSFDNFLYFINAACDFTGETIEQVMERTTNIPYAIIDAGNFKLDELGLKYLNYGSLKKIFATNPFFWENLREKEISNRKQNRYRPMLLPYPWGKNIN